MDVKMDVNAMVQNSAKIGDKNEIATTDESPDQSFDRSPDHQSPQTSQDASPQTGYDGQMTDSSPNDFEKYKIPQASFDFTVQRFKKTTSTGSDKAECDVVEKDTACVEKDTGCVEKDTATTEMSSSDMMCEDEIVESEDNVETFQDARLRERKTGQKALTPETNNTTIKIDDTALDRFLLMFLNRRQNEEYNYFGIGYILYFHVLAIIGLLLGFHDGIRAIIWGPDGLILLSKPAETFLWTLILWPTSAIGITAGCHRLWAHKSYQATPTMKVILMVMNSIANQKSIYHWARDHRTHHRFSDTEKDPHDSSRGLFYAHIGWLFFKKGKAVIEASRANIDISDLDADVVVQFQKKLDPYWNTFFCFGFPALFANLMWGENLLAGFLLAGCLRYIFVLHCTWCVNSLVHTQWAGPSTYDENEPPAESRIVSLLACGEGWHSWHHRFGFDYKASELGCLQQWNPTKVFIDFFAMLGMVHGRRTGNAMWEREKIRRGIVPLGIDISKNPEAKIEEYLEGPPLFKVRKLREINGRREIGEKK